MFPIFVFARFPPDCPTITEPRRPSSHQSRIFLSLSLSVFSQYTIYSPHVALITGSTSCLLTRDAADSAELFDKTENARVALTYFPKRPNPHLCNDRVVFSRIDRPDSLPYPPYQERPRYQGYIRAEHAAKSVVPLLLPNISNRSIPAYHSLEFHIATMSHNFPQTSSSANYQAMFDEALKVYERKTRKDLASDPLLRRLESCHSPDTALDVLREQIPAFDQSGSKLTTWVTPTINVLYTFSSTIGGAVSLVSTVKVIKQDPDLTSAFQAYPPAGVIVTGIGSLLSVGNCPAKFYALVDAHIPRRSKA